MVLSVSYIIVTMKYHTVYTFSGSTLQTRYRRTDILTLSFLSLISRGVGGSWWNTKYKLQNCQKLLRNTVSTYGSTSAIIVLQYEGSKAKRKKVAQQLDLLPETSEKLFSCH